MKKEVLIALAIVLALPIVYAATVTQTAPANNTLQTSPDVLFTCNTPGPATSLALNINITGTFERNRTETGTGAISLSYTIYNLANGAYNWNCISTDAVGETASANWTFTINATRFSGTIPNYAITVGQNSTPFDLDSYFTAATTYAVKGNSTVKVTIDSENMVTFYSANATSETINFTSGTAVSNNILVTATAATAPTISCLPIPTQTWSKNTNLTLNLLSYCSSSSTINFTASTVPHIAINITGGTAKLTPEKDWTGNGTVTFIAKAGSTTVNTSGVLLNVKEPAQTLKIISYLPASQPQIPPGGTQAFQITKTGTGVIRVVWYLDNQVATTATGDSYTYSGATVGTHNIRAEVSDGIQTLSQNWTVTVAAQQEAPVQAPPPLTQPEPEVTVEVCGNGKCGGNENCANCEKDCACSENQVCKEKQCVEKKTNMTLIITTTIIMALIIGGAVAYYLITQKPKIEQRDETKIEEVEVKPPADITDFYEKAAPPKEEQKPASPKPVKKESPAARYIRDMRSQGQSDEAIKKNLKTKGWKEQQISEAFKEA